MPCCTEHVVLLILIFCEEEYLAQYLFSHPNSTAQLFGDLVVATTFSPIPVYMLCIFKHRHRAPHSIPNNHKSVQIP